MNWVKENDVQYSQHNRTFLYDVGVYVCTRFFSLWLIKGTTEYDCVCECCAKR
jgi:hypothetical protein